MVLECSRTFALFSLKGAVCCARFFFIFLRSVSQMLKISHEAYLSKAHIFSVIHNECNTGLHFRHTESDGVRETTVTYNLTQLENVLEITRMLEDMPNLRSFNMCSFFYLGTSHALYLIEALKKHVLALSELRMVNIRIHASSFYPSVFGSILTPTLTSLYLKWIEMDNEGAHGLAISLKNTPKLETLVLRFNGICDEGVIHLARGLEHTPELRQLDLGCNQITSSGVVAVFRAFKHVPKLNVCRVGSNGPDSKIVDVLDELKHVPNLTCFHMNQQRCSKTNNMLDSVNLYKTMQAVLKYTPKMDHLVLDFENLNTCLFSNTFEPYPHCRYTKAPLQKFKEFCEHNQKMLVASKLSLIHASVGSEYPLPDEMVEEVCKYVCPIQRIEGDYLKWKFTIEHAHNE